MTMLNVAMILPFSDLALVSCVLGGLFLARFLLALRRLPETGLPYAERVRMVRTPQAFGAELEPERRHAARQLLLGLVFGAVGLALALALWHAFAGPSVPRI